MNTWMKSLALGLFLTLGAYACDGGVTEPDSVDDSALRADAALVATDGMFQDLAVFQDLGLPGFGLAPSAASSDNFSFSRMVSYFDGSGTEMDQYDPLLTASIHVVADASGTREKPFWEASIERHREFTVTGLEGVETQRTTDGTGTETVARSRYPVDAAEQTYDMSAIVTYAGIVHGVPRSEYPYPLAGTITRQVHVIVMQGDEVLGNATSPQS